MKRLTVDKMPVGAYFGPFSKMVRYPEEPDVLDDRSYRLASEAGLNFLIGYSERYPANREAVRRSLDLAEKFGMRMILSDANIEQGTIESKLQREGRLPDFSADYRESVSDHGDHPAYWGCYIVDEPLPLKFPLLSRIRDAFEAVSPDKLFFVNMLPVYGISAMEGEFWIEDAARREEVYTRYLAGYLDTVRPPLLCYDLYPFQGEFPAVSVDYFTNLAVASREAKKRDIPFWVSPQAAVQGPMREIGGAEMMMQVNTSLAFGAQGLVYFCWSMPYDGMCGSEKYAGAITDRGKPMPLYAHVARANAWVKKTEDFLMTAKHLGVTVCGLSPAPVPGYASAAESGPLEGIEGDHVLVGVFERRGKYGYLVVNNGIEKSCSAILRFSEGARFLRVSPEEGDREVSGRVKEAIPAGHAVLYIQQ